MLLDSGKQPQSRTALPLWYLRAISGLRTGLAGVQVPSKYELADVSLFAIPFDSSPRDLRKPDRNV